MPSGGAHDAERVLTALGDLTSRFDPRLLKRYIEEILEWNPQLGLVSKQDTPEVLARLIARSVEFWDFVSWNVDFDPADGERRAADIGAGAGFPGLVWRLLVPELDMVLIERKSRRAFFLERVARRFRLDNVETLEADLRDVARRTSCRGKFDLVTMMAVAPPEDLIRPIEDLLKVGGYLSTIRPSTETTSPETLGSVLEIAATAKAPDALYHLYRKVK